MRLKKILMIALLSFSLVTADSMAYAAENQTELPESTEETEAVSNLAETEPAGETEAVSNLEETEPAGETEAVSNLTENETTELPESTEDAQTPENTERMENTESIENTESTEMTENTEEVPEAENTQETELPENSETVDAAENPIENAIQDLSMLAGGREITLDANPKEWADVPSYTSSDPNISKWSAAQNDKYLYLYIQMTGGNQYGLPLESTYITVTYEDGTADDRSNEIRFSGMISVKDKFYGDVEGASAFYAPSQEKNKYEAEICIPQTFFKNHNFTLNYCGVSVSANDITVLNTLGEIKEEVPVYNGITIDGNFKDWNVISKVFVNDGSIIETAAVFDGDWLYIYLKDTGNYAATYDGSRHSGVYEILTDTGRRTSFKLRLTGIEGIPGALLEYSNDQYEIAIPKTALKEYRLKISFGYAQAKTPMIADITDTQGGGTVFLPFSGITMDGSFGDWKDYNHTLIEYSTTGAFGDDADGALYIQDSKLYGHVKTYRYADEKNPYEPFMLVFNHDKEKSISFRFITVDQNGNINWNPEVGVSDTAKEYFLVDVKGWSNASTRGELEDSGYYGNKILGRAFLKRGSGSDTEIEYEIYLETLAEYISNNNSVYSFSLAATDMKTIQAYYVNIGEEPVTIAGTSSGPLLGVVICIMAAAMVLYYQKRKEKGMV